MIGGPTEQLFSAIPYYRNRTFSDRHINIAAQYLQTRAEVGYAVIDIDVEHSDHALTKLAEVPGTLRSRVLF